LQDVQKILQELVDENGDLDLEKVAFLQQNRKR
jgi:Fe-S-cluster formation regulator IscX/YfhJ